MYPVSTLCRRLSLAFFATLPCLLAQPLAAETRPEASPAAAEKPTASPGISVRVETSMGDFTITLAADKAPKTVENFLQYVDDGFYEGLLFHRVIPDFMIQGGGLTPDMERKKTRQMVRNESENGLLNVRGSIAMARTSNPHSASSQFFVNLIDNEFLDRQNARDGWGYCVFGEVSEGMDVVDAIADVPTGRRGRSQNVPQEDVTIKRITRIKAN